MSLIKFKSDSRGEVEKFIDVIFSKWKKISYIKYKFSNKEFGNTISFFNSLQRKVDF